MQVIRFPTSRKGACHVAGVLRRYRATIIAAVIIAVALISLLAFSFVRSRGGRGAIALVHDGDGAVHELPLDEDTVLEVTTSLGTNTIVVEDGTVRMVEADCPHGDCTRQSPISQPGQQIICLPHELWIEIVASGGDTATGGVDTVAG